MRDQTKAFITEHFDSAIVDFQCVVKCHLIFGQAKFLPAICGFPYFFGQSDELLDNGRRFNGPVPPR